jgi:hypothetical protein
VAAVIELARPQTLPAGRDFSRIALLGSILISAAALLRPARSLRGAQLVAELVVAQCIIASLVWLFTGDIAVDWFFIGWWLVINAYVMLPWTLFSSIRYLTAARRT